MNSEYYKSEIRKKGNILSRAVRLIRTLCGRVEQLLFSRKLEKEPNDHTMKKQLRCTISSCFDKHNICCKVCDIKKCRYKCNFIDKEECEHQKLD